MKRKLLFAIFILFSLSKVQAQRQTKIDSLLAALPHSQDTTKVDQLLSLSHLYRKTSEDSALLFAQKALSLSKQIRETARVGYSCLTLSDIHTDYGSQLDSALYYGQLAKNVFADVHDTMRLAQMFQRISYILLLQSNLDQAYAYIDSASVIFSKKKDTADYIETLLQKVQYQSNAGHFEQARVFINEIRSLSSKYNFGKYQLMRVYNFLGAFYLQTEQNDSAIYYLGKALAMIEETTDLRGVSYTSGMLGIAYSKKGNWEKAIHYTEKGLRLAQQNHFMKETGDNLNDLYTVYKAKCDFQNALKYYEQYNALQDSLNASSQKTSLDKVNLELTNVKNVNRIELLKKDNEVQQSEVAKQKLIRDGVLGGLVVVLVFAFIFFFQRNSISRERKRSDKLLLNILPEETAEELKTTGAAEAKSFDEVTVMFTDFKNFTQASEKMNAKELVSEINYIFSEFDRIISKHNIEKIKTIGDSYMCAGGLPVVNKTNATDVVDAALEIQYFMNQLKEQREKENKHFFEIRIGIHSGPVVAGIVGIKKFAYDIWGDTVNISSRMESSGEADKVNISGATYELVKDKFNCTYRGKIQAKNKGEIDMYFVEAKFKAIEKALYISSNS